MPGHTKASTPNTIAASPRKASTHQFLARTGRTGLPAPALVFVVMNTPFSVFTYAPPALLLLVLAQEEQVKERQECSQRRSQVGKGSSRKYAPCALGLRAREHAVVGSEIVGAGRGVYLNRQRHNVKRQDRHKQDGRQLEEEGNPYEYAHDEQGQPDLAAKSHHRKEPRPELHRQVAARVLDGVSALVGRHAHSGDGSLLEVPSESLTTFLLGS